MKRTVAWAFYALLGLFAGVSGFTFFYARGASYLSNEPAVCVNCHIMREHYDGWQKASHHAVAVCNDCHLPGDLLGKYWTKAENGYRHSKGFTFQDFHEPIRIRPKNSKIVNDNCLRCHGDFVREITAAHGGTDDYFDCVRCHDGVGHGPVK
ncbi:MAG: cytochrome c nitrite reductase small subunit [Planctomycetota bacterium]